MTSTTSRLLAAAQCSFILILMQGRLTILNERLTTFYEVVCDHPDALIAENKNTSTRKSISMRHARSSTNFLESDSVE